MATTAMSAQKTSEAERCSREAAVEELVDWLKESPEKLKTIREMDERRWFKILEEAWKKAMAEGIVSVPLPLPLPLPDTCTSTPPASKQHQQQTLGEPVSLRRSSDTQQEVIETDSKRGGPTSTPSEALAMPKSERDSDGDSGIAIQNSARKSHSGTESTSKGSISKGSEDKGSVQTTSVAPKKTKSEPGEKNQTSPVTTSANSTPRKGLAIIKKTAAPSWVLTASEKAEVQEGSVSPPSKPDRKLDQAHANPQKTFAETEKAEVLTSVRSAPGKAEHEGSIPAQTKPDHKNAPALAKASSTPPKAFTKTEKPVASKSPGKRERNEGSFSKGDRESEQAQPQHSSSPGKAFQKTEEAVVLHSKTEQRIKLEIREIFRLLKGMTGPQEVVAARIVGSIAGAKYLQSDGVDIRMDLDHPLPRRAHDALLDFVRWGIAADIKKAEGLISKYSAVGTTPKPVSTQHAMKRKREEMEEQVSLANRKVPACATFKAPGIKRTPSPQKRKVGSQETTPRSRAAIQAVKRKREEDDAAPPPKKQKSLPAAESVPIQLPSFVRRHGEKKTSNRNLTRLEDTLYGRRRI
ncbi:uncharacterized protein MYCFIDRAFT_80055 [Pseudocercospora fijiensis CIRAD86]|uniref:Uncharacterized protein n=1 Tax=Pseudocercospora fijiensis (strain CIRAD86) TaxID=383855 RepID=N1Q7J9_PSEFD|nr:uncharacterized protein MYCFIDRAFT_80055 [Pseudocercospora fijiensis CIRAD86]EME88675.1 hypothetical protein MYCFIDRAFT_80055 [Pseudocercospora fijiensis CIRAD86]